jgi:hypothetical protein
MDIINNPQAQNVRLICRYRLFKEAMWVLFQRFSSIEGRSVEIGGLIDSLELFSQTSAVSQFSLPHGFFHVVPRRCLGKIIHLLYHLRHNEHIHFCYFSERNSKWAACASSISPLSSTAIALQGLRLILPPIFTKNQNSSLPLFTRLVSSDPLRFEVYSVKGNVHSQIRRAGRQASFPIHKLLNASHYLEIELGPGSDYALTWF